MSSGRIPCTALPSALTQTCLSILWVQEALCPTNRIHSIALTREEMNSPDVIRWLKFGTVPRDMWNTLTGFDLNMLDDGVHIPLLVTLKVTDDIHAAAFEPIFVTRHESVFPNETALENALIQFCSFRCMGESGTKLCASCGAPAIKSCGRCRALHYCGVTCRDDHFSVHKTWCKRVGKVRTALQCDATRI